MIIFTSIILVHEFGHVLAGMFFGWNIERVLLLPFGAITIFKEKINRSLFEEFIILIMGPLFQVIGTLCYLVFDYDLFVLECSKIILFFNLLPIFPLDGSKFLNIIFNKFFSFKRSHLLTIYVSFLTIFGIIIKTNFNLLMCLILVFLLIKVFRELLLHKYFFNLFLLERVTNNFGFKKVRVVNNIYKMKKDFRHIIKNNGKCYTEREFLQRIFDFKGKTW